MSLYTRARKHIDMRRVKEMREEKIKREQIAELVQQQEKIRVELEYIEAEESKYFNWRKELNEGMTSSGLLLTTLVATGDKVNTEIAVNDSSSFSADSGSYILGGGGSFAPFDYTINGNFNGTLSGQSAFTFSAPFNVPGDVTPHRTNIESFDQSTNRFTVNNDTITFSAIAGNSSSNGSGLGSNGGTRPTNPLYVSLYVIEDDGSETYVDLGTVPRTTTSLTNFEFKIPQSAFGKQAYLNLYNQQYTTANNWWYGTTLPWHPEGVNDNGVVEDFHMILNHANLNPASGWPSLSKTSIALQAWTDMQKAYSGSSWSNDGGPAGYPAPVSGGTRKLDEQDSEGNIIPQAMTMADLEYIVNYIESTFAQYRGMTTTTYAVTNLQFKRQLPMNVFVGLDDPDASSFVRDGDFDRLSPADKKKKLEEQLAASKEYLDKMFGEGMPGTATEIADYEPQQSFSDIAQRDPYTDDDGANPFNPTYDKDTDELLDDSDFDPNDFEYAGLRPDGTQGFNQPGDEVYDPATKKKYKLVPKKGYGYNEWIPIEKAGGGGTEVAHYEPQGKVLSEKKRLKSPKSIVDKIPGYYDGKPAPLGFPIEEPPKMKNGYHPDLVDGKKVSNRYNRLDPISARAMPKTGNPHIDKKVRKASKKPK